MTISSLAKSTATPPHPESLSSADAGILTQSRETGEEIPDLRLENGPAAERLAPEVKPWAHFVAGG